MKRVVVLVICFLILHSCVVMVSAEDSATYETAGQLYAAWMEQDCVPDYIAGVWSRDGSSDNLVFAIVEGADGEQGKQEVLALIRDDFSVTFVYRPYSRNYLYRIQKEIEETYFEVTRGLLYIGVHEYKNRVHLAVVVSDAENEDVQDAIQQITQQYGDAVYISYLTVVPNLVSGTQPAPTGPMLVVGNPRDQMVPWGFALAMGVILLAFLCIVEQRRRRLLAITEDEALVIMDSSAISEKEVEDAIRKAEITPSKALDDRVMRSIQSDS